MLDTSPGYLERAFHFNVTTAFVLSKAADDPGIVLESIEHLRRYFELLFRAAGGHRAPWCTESRRRP